MRVGVNLLWMVHGEVGGSETYTLSHLEALVERASADLDLVLFTDPGFADRHRDLSGAVEVVEAPWSSSSRIRRVATEATWLARAATEAKVSVVHHPGGTTALRDPVPTVLTVHDLQWVTFPEYFSRFKLAYLRSRVGPSIRAATAVTVNSHFVAGTVADYAGIDVADIAVVPPALRPLADPVDVAPDVAHRYELDRPWVIYAAITYPHKNHGVLLEALARRAAGGRSDVLLVLTGGSAGAEDGIATMARRLGVADLVRRVGRVPDDDLDALFRGAVGVVFPSTYEGFGMGVVEGMARGVPVAAADVTALPEVVGDAGLLLDPHDPEAWAEAMSRFVDDDDLRRDLGEAGRRRIERYSPERAADSLLAVYRRAATGR